MNISWSFTTWEPQIENAADDSSRNSSAFLSFTATSTSSSILLQEDHISVDIV